MPPRISRIARITGSLSKGSSICCWPLGISKVRGDTLERFSNARILNGEPVSIRSTLAVRTSHEPSLAGALGEIQREGVGPVGIPRGFSRARDPLAGVRDEGGPAPSWQARSCWVSCEAFHTASGGHGSFIGQGPHGTAVILGRTLGSWSRRLGGWGGLGSSRRRSRRRLGGGDHLAAIISLKAGIAAANSR